MQVNEFECEYWESELKKSDTATTLSNSESYPITSQTQRLLEVDHPINQKKKIKTNNAKINYISLKLKQHVSDFSFQKIDRLHSKSHLHKI